MGAQILIYMRSSVEKYKRGLHRVHDASLVNVAIIGQRKIMVHTDHSILILYHGVGFLTVFCVEPNHPLKQGTMSGKQSLSPFALPPNLVLGRRGRQARR